MKLTAKGIGWLIAGLIICASSTESYGIAAKLSTIALGLVFVAVYLMKQVFVPRGIGWFIAGGVLVAFVVEEGLTEEGLISVGIAAACLAVFYFRNRHDIDNAAGEWSIEYDSDEEGGVEADPKAAPAYDPDADPGEDPYAMADYPVEEYQEPEHQDDGSGSAGGSSADSGSEEVVDFEIDMKEKE